MEIKHQMFKEEEFNEMMAWLNGNCKNNITIISITQAKNNDFNIFYWSN